MTQETENKWQQAIRDAESLDRSARNSDRYVAIMTDAMILSLLQMYTDAVNEEFDNWDQNVEDTTILFKKLGNYTIQRNHEGLRINLTAEYAEIEDLLKEIFVKEATK